MRRELVSGLCESVAGFDGFGEAGDLLAVYSVEAEMGDVDSGASQSSTTTSGGDDGSGDDSGGDDGGGDGNTSADTMIGASGETGPGLGVLSALAGVCAATAGMLSRKSDDDEDCYEPVSAGRCAGFHTWTDPDRQTRRHMYQTVRQHD